MCTYPAPVDRALRCVRHSSGLNGERSPAISRVVLRRPIDEARSVPSELPRRGDHQGTRGAAVTVRHDDRLPDRHAGHRPGKWFRGMTLIPGYGAVGCNPQEHPAADVPIRPDLAHRPGLPGRRRESSRAPDRAIPGGSTADPPDVQRAGRSWRHDAARRWTDATAATVRNGSRSAGRQPRPVTFVPRAETSKGRLPPLTWEPVSGFEPLTCRLQDGCSAY